MISQLVPLSVILGTGFMCFFHLAGILLTHHAKLIEFVEKQCTAAGLIRTILKDLKNGKIMAQEWALGVLGKVLTGPSMTQFYSSEMTNLEMVGRPALGAMLCDQCREMDPQYGP